jgi:FkbM family methyltransferase
MNALHDTPKHKDLVYDIGMHKGEDTEFYLRKGFRVVAFEADPDLVELCRNRFRQFIDQDRLTIVAGAIIDRDAIGPDQQKVWFYRNNDVSVWGTVCVNWAERNARLGASSSILEVDVIDFARIMQQHGIPHYMKIDIEGFDMACINALRLFRERPDYISLESDKTSFANIKLEIDTFARLGYDSFQAIEQSGISRAQIPPNPAKEGAYVPWRFENGSSGLFGAELDGEWQSKAEILRQYRVIRLGYYLLGDDGILNQWKFRGAWMPRLLIRSLLKLVTRANVPGWYDTHARLSCKDARMV